MQIRNQTCPNTIFVSGSGQWIVSILSDVDGEGISCGVVCPEYDLLPAMLDTIWVGGGGRIAACG